MKHLTLLAASLGLVLAGSQAYADDHAGDHGKPPMEGEHKNPFDKDGDGALSKSEFLAMQTAHFEKADANNDGKVTREEMKNSRKEMYGKMKDKYKGKRHDRDNHDAEE